MADEKPVAAASPADQDAKAATAPTGAQPSASEWLGFIKSALWPAVALIALALFAAPVTEVVRAIPAVAANVDTLTIGEITLTTSRPPPTEVRTILSQTTRDDLQYLIENGSSEKMCTLPSLPEGASRLRLIELGLAEPMSTDCATLTELGGDTRQYLIELLFSQVIKET
jgi:hypothetical protein